MTHPSLNPPAANGRPSSVVDVQGPGTERGHAHGETLRIDIAEALDRWRGRIEERQGLSARDYIRWFLGSTRHVEAIYRHAPELHDEIVGIAKASNQPSADVFAYNLMDEEWRFGRDLGHGCSLIATPTASGHPLIAQNMDLPISMGSSQIVLRVAPHESDPEQIILSGAGMIGLFGVNSHGLAICVNTLNALPYSADGLPVSVIVRSLLRLEDVSQAKDFLSTTRHAAGQHYGLADRTDMRGVECSAQGWGVGPQASTLLHTNHPLWHALDAEDPDDFLASGTRTRLASLEASLESVRLNSSAEPVLSSTANGLCVLPTDKKPSTTFCSAEFLLADPPLVRVALGRPDASTWQSVEWISVRDA